MLRFFALVAGAVVGGALGEGFGALAGAALAWLGFSLQQQATLIAKLRLDVDALSARARARPGSELAPGAAQPPPQVPVQAPLPAAAPLLRPDATEASTATTIAAPLDAPAESKWADEPHDTEVGSLWGDIGNTPAPAAPASAAPTPGAPSPAPFDWLAPVKRWLFGANTIVKLGVAILFIGLAFLAKFAAQHVDVPVEFRLAGVGSAAIVLLGLGWRLRLKRTAYAQVLQGGAVAVLYLTLFVAFRFYEVLTVGPAFACMVAVAALAAALAVIQDARALAVIGALGGFATPLLVSTGAGNHVALFSYYLVLDLGIAAVAWHRSWRLLNLIGFFATFGVGAVWGVLRYRADDYASAQAFLIAYFLVFAAILLMPARRFLREADAADTTDTGPPPRSGDAWVNASLLFGLPTIGFALQHGMVRSFEYGSAISALVLALFYVGLAAWMRARPRLALMFEASLAIGTVFLTLVIPFALDAHSTSGAWALEGAGLVWLGLRQQRVAPRIFGYALLLLAGVAMFHALQRHGMPTRFFNALLFNGVLAAAASLAAAYFVKRHGAFIASAAVDSAWRLEASAEPWLIGWGTLWLVLTAAAQIDKFAAPHHELTAWLACASAIAVLFTELAQRLTWPRIAWPVLGHAPLLALCVAVSALTQDSPGQHGGWWAWPLALAAHLFFLWRGAPHWAAQAAAQPKLANPANLTLQAHHAVHLIHTLGLLVLAALGALQGRAITRDWGDPASAWAWLGWLLIPAALLLWLPRAGFASRWPVRVAPAAYQTHAGGLIAAGLLLWTLLANVASNGAASPLPHVPLLNPLDLGVGIALLSAWLWMRSSPALPLLGHQPNIAVQVSAVAGFVWLNAILIRAFHHYGGVPFRWRAWSDSLAVQSGISLLWSATALVLMWLAARRALRTPWMVGAVLLGAVVLKLVLIDLSGTGTVTRIVSFIGVGVSMLIIGYVAPLPAAHAKEVPRASP